MKERPGIWLLVIVLAVPAIAFSIVNWYEKKVQPLPVLGVIEAAPAISLYNQEGHTVQVAAWNRRTTVTAFFFTHCPVICPEMVRNLQKIQAAFADDTSLAIVTISVDPERDSTARLKQYARIMDIRTSNWQLLTGSKKEIYTLARNRFRIVATDGDGGPADFIHSEKLVLTDKQKRIRGYYQGTSSAETDQLITDIKKLDNEN